MKDRQRKRGQREINRGREREGRERGKEGRGKRLWEGEGGGSRDCGREREERS